MANWATTSYRIENKPENLHELHNLCKAFLNKERPVMEEGASEEWEGNIILALGIDKGSSYLRGFIQECELEDGVLRIEANEAWGATDFRHLLEGHYEDMKVYYIVEEEGCEVYATNDVEGSTFHIVLPLTPALKAKMNLNTLRQKPKHYSILQAD